MSLPDPPAPHSPELRSLAWLVVLLSGAFVLILWPFLGAVLSAHVNCKVAVTRCANQSRRP